MKPYFLACIGFLMLLSGCKQGADSTEAQEVNRQQDVYVTNQPVKFFSWSLPRHIMNELYTAKNRAVTTYSYVINQYTGQVIFSCPSVGFPISAATQLTNPDAIARRLGSRSHVLPQAEPDGLYPPSTSRGTYVMCLNNDGTVAPTYWEEDVATTTRPLHVINGHLAFNSSQPSNIKIDLHKKATTPP